MEQRDKALYTRHRWRVEGIHGKQRSSMDLHARFAVVSAIWRSKPTSPQQQSTWSG